MNFQQLRIIREAVRRGYNLTEVANALNTSQSGVSKHIKDLEDELGLELFIRKGKRLLGLTEPGEELAVVVDRMLMDARNIKSIAAQFSNKDHGQLTIATTHTQARYVLPVPVARQAHPPQPLLTAQALVFRYHDQARPILQNCNLRIYTGERLLLEGPSGGGKSTLAALLAGLRMPSTGVLTLGGHDWRMVDVAAWRRQVVIVPQFHENYVLTGTLAFNLLLGRHWPPTAEELTMAEAICRELGLGDLLDRMPAGLQQMVGESGWRLSHGERSRVYIARALLQGADLMILDESFAALVFMGLGLLRLVLTFDHMLDFGFDPVVAVGNASASPTSHFVARDIGTTWCIDSELSIDEDGRGDLRAGT